MTDLMLSIPTTSAVLADLEVTQPLPRWPGNRFAIDVCRKMRRTAMMQARKHKDGGDTSRCLEWLGYALYWSRRASNRTELQDATQTHTSLRMLAWAHKREFATIDAMIDAENASVIAAVGVRK